MPIKNWTDEEFNGLKEWIPLWWNRDLKKDKQDKGFYVETAVSFAKAFPTTGKKHPDLNRVWLHFMPCAEYLLCVQKIWYWFHYHSKESSSSLSTLSLLGTKPCKIVPLMDTQAYSHHFYRKDSPLHEELWTAYELYISGDEETVNKYQTLFHSHPTKNLPFVLFQQVVLKNKALLAEECLAADDFINKHYKDQKRHVECPWDVLKSGKSQTNTNLKRKFIKKVHISFPLY